MADRSTSFSVQFDPGTALGGRHAGLKEILRCRKDLKHFSGRIILQFICFCAAAFSFAEIPRYLGRLINLFTDSVLNAILFDSFELDRTALLKSLIPVVVLLPAHLLFYNLASRFVSSIASGYTDRMRCRVFEKILRVRMDYLDLHSKSKLHEIATEKIDSMGQGLNLLLSRVLYGCEMLVALVVSCGRDNPYHAVVLLIVILLFVLLRILTLFSHSQQTFTQTLVDTDAYYQNLPLLRVSGKSRLLSQALIRAQTDRLHTVQRIRFTDSFGRIAAVFLTGLAVIAVLLRSVYVGEVIGIGSLFSVFLYVRRVESPLTNISFFSSAFRSLADSAAHVYDFLDAQEENDCGLPPVADADGRYRISFEDVCFAYTPQSADILHGLSCSFADRGIFVIRGETGIGKTTILKLLTGFYLPNSGSVSLNGVSTAQLDLPAYRRLFSVIVQEATLFERTIAENIAYPDAQADKDRIFETLARIGQPQLTDFLKEKLDTVFLPDAKMLSDGQIQLVLIARALYHHKRFLILDESLSHLDADSTQIILRILQTISKETGVILISHRSADTPHADHVLTIGDAYADKQRDAFQN